jgi:hypothetical protein
MMTTTAALLVSSGCVLFLQAACSSSDEAIWREEVQLATGQTVVVNRLSIRGKSGFPVSRRGAYRLIRVIFPDGLTWDGDAAREPIAIEIKDKVAYVAVNLQSWDVCLQYGHPAGSIAFFRRDGSNWVQVPRSEYPSNGSINLIYNPWGRSSSEDISGFVKNADKPRLRIPNDRVGTRLDEAIASDRTLDACSMLKRDRPAA